MILGQIKQLFIKAQVPADENDQVWISTYKVLKDISWVIDHIGKACCFVNIHKDWYEGEPNWFLLTLNDTGINLYVYNKMSLSISGAGFRGGAGDGGEGSYFQSKFKFI